MKPFTRSIIELFDGKKRYVIPMFQRQYVWREDPQLGRIWDDLKTKTELRLSNKTTMPHFLGAIVISQLPTFGRQIQAYDVIDGQQRLTTFQILLNALRDAAKLLDSEFAVELNKYILNDGIMEEKIVECYKVWPTQVDRPQMKALVNSGSLQSVKEKEDSELGKKKTGVEPYMIGAYRYFYDQISAFIAQPFLETEKEERVEALFEALKRDLNLVAIELEGGDDPQVIFETLNGFSQPLLPTDLMRNFVFQRAYREKRKEEDKKPDDLYNEYWLPFDRHFWKREEKQGRLKRPRVDIFFQHFLAMKKATDINVGRLYHEYKSWIETEKPYFKVEEELKDSVYFSEIFKDLLTPEQPSELSKFAAMLNVFDVKTILPLILYLKGEAALSGENLQEALIILESFLVRRAICGLTTKNYNRLFLQLIDSLRGKEEPVNVLRQELLKGSGDAVVWPDDDSLLYKWQNANLYNELSSSRLQYILKSIEQVKRTKKNEDIVIKSVLSIEHVMPVKWWTNWPLKDGRLAKSDFERLLANEIDEEASLRDSFKHRIGNLTIVTPSFNSSLSNSSYEDKKKEILAQSALALNREFNCYPVWDGATITLRGKELFDNATLIWPHFSNISLSPT